jgi:cytoskeleton protein RodZ
MGSFGDRLKREREMRGIKLEEIAESTKIGKRNLTALEDERFDQLPGGIFNKGFVRAYAKFLGLDEEQMVSDYLTAAANYEQPSEYSASDSMVRPAALPSEASVRRKNRMWVIASLLLLAAAFFVWLHYSRRAQRRSELATDSQSIAQIAQDQGQTNAPVGLPVPPPPGYESATAGMAAANQDTGAQAQNATTGNKLTSQNQPLPTGERMTGEGFTVSVQTREAAWVAFIADGKTVVDAVLMAGESRTVRAHNQLILRTGNAGGIDVSFNGTAVPSLGAEKQVKTVSFTPQGLQP